MTTAADAARTTATTSTGVKSSDGASVATMLLDLPRAQRRLVVASITRDEPALLAPTMAEVKRYTGTAFGLWHDDPSGFIEDVIGETIWSRQVEVGDALRHYKRVAVPAGFGVGKTFLAGRLVAWAGATNPVGTIVIVTTATRFRQVKYQLWPHIKTAVAKGGLPGQTDSTQWKAPDIHGNDVVVAYGFSAPENDEAAMQGIHGTPKLLLVVDEAGGIPKIIGRGTNNLLTGDAAMLAIGNPPMNDPGSWFEELCAEGEDEEETSTITIRIAATDSPAITGEVTPICRACVPNLDGHTIAGGTPSHLPDQEWLDRTMREYGDPEHPYIVAKVRAEFPADGGSKVIPHSWVDAGVNVSDPHGGEFVRLCDLGLEDEKDTFTVKLGAWIRLGVDVAADGGDELSMHRAIGNAVHAPVPASSGAINGDPVVVAEKILEQILRAEALAEAIGSKQQIEVKIDANGLGWGVAGNLKRWGETGRHHSKIVAVMVSESPAYDDEAAAMRPWRKRDEMWLGGRTLLQLDPSTGFGSLRLRIDTKTKAQLSAPNLGYNSQGRVVVESKDSMRRRGVNSPDRAESLLLAVYSPEPPGMKRRGLLFGSMFGASL